MATLQDIRSWANKTEPLFLCGLERSGTSILQVSLARHPDLFAVKDVYETFAFLNAKALLEEPMPSMAKAYLMGGANADKFRQFCAGLRKGDQPLGDGEVIRSYFFFAAHFIYPGRRVLEKTPGHVRKLPRVFELFPRAKVVVCTRDPLDVIASYRKRLAKEKSMGKSRDEWGWLDKTDDQLMAHFENITKHLQEAQAKWPGQVFVAPYDWITESPDQALKDVCAFAGLPFVKEVLTPKQVSGRKVDEMLSSPITKRASEAEQFLDAKAIAAIKKRTDALLPVWNARGVKAA